MPKAKVNGVELHYEDTGAGFPLIFCHEFAGDMRSWEPQVRHFARRYRIVTFNYRGYPPSSVPEHESAYGHDQLVDDLRALMNHLGISRAHVAGLATGGNLALNFAIAHPQLVAGLVVAGAGAGTTDREAGWPVRKNSPPISNGTEPQAWLRMSPLRRNASSFATRIRAAGRASSP